MPSSIIFKLRYSSMPLRQKGPVLTLNWRGDLSVLLLDQDWRTRAGGRRPSYRRRHRPCHRWAALPPFVQSEDRAECEPFVEGPAQPKPALPVTSHAAGHGRESAHNRSSSTKFSLLHLSHNFLLRSPPHSGQLSSWSTQMIFMNSRLSP
jgi:hypothetical protein